MRPRFGKEERGGMEQHSKGRWEAGAGGGVGGRELRGVWCRISNNLPILFPFEIGELQWK